MPQMGDGQCYLFDGSKTPYVKIKDYQGHRGLDMFGQNQSSGTPPNGVPVYSPCKLKIVKVYNTEHYSTKGNLIGCSIQATMLDGNMPNKGLYLEHFATGSIVVADGSTVEKGQRLGTQGQTGDASGNHVHVEIWESATSDVNHLAYKSQIPSVCGLSYPAQLNTEYIYRNTYTLGSTEPPGPSGPDDAEWNTAVRERDVAKATYDTAQANWAMAENNLKNQQDIYNKNTAIKSAVDEGMKTIIPAVDALGTKTQTVAKELADMPLFPNTIKEIEDYCLEVFGI